MAALTPLPAMSDWAFSSLLGHTLSQRRCVSATINRCDLVIKQGGGWGGATFAGNEDADKYKFVSKIGGADTQKPPETTYMLNVCDRRGKLMDPSVISSFVFQI